MRLTVSPRPGSSESEKPVPERSSLRRLLHPLALVLVLALGPALIGCSTDTSDTGDGSADLPPYDEQAQSSQEPQWWWVDSQVRKLVLAEAYERTPDAVAVLRGEDGEPYFESREQAWETNIDVLVESGLIVSTPHGYEADTDVSLEDASDGMPLNAEGIDQVVRDTLQESEVDWCESEPVNAEEFAREVLDSVQGAYDTAAEYTAAIEGHVECTEG